MAAVVLENVGKRFGAVMAASGVNLNVRDGEFIVLVGPSGCGKSTTLRMIAGLEPLSEGTIKLDERVVNDLPPKHRDIAMVFQSYALYPRMTVFNNMAFGLKMKRFERSEIERRVREVAEMLNISELLQRKPRERSAAALRAEDLTIGKAQSPHHAAIDAVVDVVELMGSEALVFLTIDGSEVAARCDAGTAGLIGSRVCLAADTERMHLIEPDSGRVVSVRH